MKLIVGLGNPGRRYEGTRHNVGFRIVDALASEARIGFSVNKFDAAYGQGTLEGQKIALLKPQTFMNLSGQTVQEALSWYKLQPEEVLIISDDIDLPPGVIRIRPHGGAGTHNGWKSIISLTGSDRFPRIRIGVGAPPPEWDLADWVLSRFGEDQPVMEEAFKLAAEAADCFVRSGIDLAMNRYNARKHADPAV